MLGASWTQVAIEKCVLKLVIQDAVGALCCLEDPRQLVSKAISKTEKSQVGIVAEIPLFLKLDTGRPDLHFMRIIYSPPHGYFLILLLDEDEVAQRNSLYC